MRESLLVKLLRFILERTSNLNVNSGTLFCLPVVVSCLVGKHVPLRFNLKLYARMFALMLAELRDKCYHVTVFRECDVMSCKQ